MSDLRFLTHEIGSLAKPPWLVKTAQGRELDESDIEHARSVDRHARGSGAGRSVGAYIRGGRHHQSHGGGEQEDRTHQGILGERAS